MSGNSPNETQLLNDPCHLRKLDCLRTEVGRHSDRALDGPLVAVLLCIGAVVVRCGAGFFSRLLNVQTGGHVRMEALLLGISRWEGKVLCGEELNGEIQCSSNDRG